MTFDTSTGRYYARDFARIGSWIPVVVLIVTPLVMPFAMRMRETRWIVGGILCAALIFGFCLTAFSLLAMRRYGKKGILGYGVVALLLYTFFAASSATLLLKMVPQIKQTMEIRRMVKEADATCPKMVNEGLRLEQVKMLSSSQVLYKYSHISVQAKHVNLLHWEHAVVLEEKLDPSEPEQMEFLKLGVIVSHDYSGVNGNIFSRFNILPEDFGFKRRSSF